MYVTSRNSQPSSFKLCASLSAFAPASANSPATRRALIDATASPPPRARCSVLTLSTSSALGRNTIPRRNTRSITELGVSLADASTRSGAAPRSNTAPPTRSASP